jgi:preprotein translocase subunit SecD
LSIAGVMTAAVPAPTWRPVEFRLAERSPGAGLTPAKIANQTDTIYLHQKIELDDRDFSGADIEKGPYGQWSVSLKLNPGGEKKVRVLTQKYRKRTLAIIVNGVVVAAPVIFGPLPEDDRLHIEGAFTEAEASRLARQLATK